MSRLVVLQRHVRTSPLLDEDGIHQIGWYTKPVDWYIARIHKTEHGITYTYDGLKNEKGWV